MKKSNLLLAGVAAFLYYKYSKMSPDKKREIANNLKQKGKQLYDEYVPDAIKQQIKTKSQA